MELLGYTSCSKISQDDLAPIDFGKNVFYYTDENIFFIFDLDNVYKMISANFTFFHNITILDTVDIQTNESLEKCVRLTPFLDLSLIAEKGIVGEISMKYNIDNTLSGILTVKLMPVLNRINNNNGGSINFLV